MRELELMVEYGMTPVQALAAATRVAAQVLGRVDLGNGVRDLGAIRPGSSGGLVVLGGDPLQDIHNLRKVVAVIVGDGEIPLK